MGREVDISEWGSSRWKLPDVVTGSDAGDTASGHGPSVTVPAPNYVHLCSRTTQVEIVIESRKDTDIQEPQQKSL